MIKSVELRRFQKHDKLKVVFDEYVTTIVGRSGSGKSCIVRGLLLALVNRGKGNNKRRKGVAYVRASIGGRRVTRRKGGKVNSYALDTKVFRAFGLGKVPEEIQGVVKCQDINFQGQHDSAFWFSLPAGRVSKELNRIVNLKIIDDVLAKAANEVRKSKSMVEVTKERLSQTKKEVEALKWVDEMTEDLAELRQKSDDLAVIVNKRSVLADLCLGVSEAVSARDLASKAILGALRAVKAGRRAAEVRGQRQALEQIVKRIRKHQRLGKVIVPEIETIRNIRVEADKAAEDRRALEHLVNQLVQARMGTCQIQEALEKAEKRLSKIKVCPTCGRKMSSPSSAGTSTCKKKHRSPEPRKTGSR